MCSPIEKIYDDLFRNKGIEVYVKRDDLLGGALHGNKFRKLKYHLQLAKDLGKTTLLTFGGAFSNHLFATAAAGVKYGFETMGIVRGAYDQNNPTVAFLKKCNMQLSFVSRSVYQQRHDAYYLDSLQNAHVNTYIIPEGGSHPLAVKGVAEIVAEIGSQSDIDFDYWICPVGSGATAAGILSALPVHQSIIACSVLKGLNVTQKIASLLSEERKAFVNVMPIDASFGGFAKGNLELHQFIERFYDSHQILIDPIYLGKVMFKLYTMIQSNFFNPGSRILVIHTGGLQGIWGYNYINGTNLPEPDPDQFCLDE